MKKALIIGASSGIGRELAFVLASKGYALGLVARRTDLLKSLSESLPTKSWMAYVDVSHPSDAIIRVEKLIQSMGEVDLVILNSGIGYQNSTLDWSKEKETIDVNVSGFCALASTLYNYFKKKGSGHLVGISSISALRGNDRAPAYSASKAFMSNYLEALAKKAVKEGLSIVVTDIQPGFVATDMMKGKEVFWVATAQEAARQIASAIQKKKRQAYITHRWRLIGWIMKVLPDWLYFKI